MCKIGIMLGTAGENLPSAILFMNSNQCDKRLQEIARDENEYSQNKMLWYNTRYCIRASYERR